MSAYRVAHLAGVPQNTAGHYSLGHLVPDMNTKDRIFGLLTMTDLSDWTVKAKEAGADIIRIYADAATCDEQFKHWHVAGSPALYGSLKHLQISARGVFITGYQHATLGAGPDSLGRIGAGGASFMMAYDESGVLTSCDPPPVPQLDFHRKTWDLPADI